jgi:hypothetical protein
MNCESIDAAFEAWWIDSYGTPPGVHARMTHTAFAGHLLKLLELMPPNESPMETTQ